jgi:hypothetical protein
MNTHATYVRDTGFDCEDSLARILPKTLRSEMRNEFAALWIERTHMLHLAVTEAASLAGTTGFPELFLPALAREKAEALARWNSRQRTVLRQSATIARSV